ncbi:MAG: hypothetical protein R3E08_08030 [Thiotrichaceae bacterium]
MSKTLELAIDLVQRASITPKDEGCQTIIADFLRRLGFEIQHLRFGEVDNLWKRRGKTAPYLYLQDIRTLCLRKSGCVAIPSFFGYAT